jgi:hypothetical protein
VSTIFARAGGDGGGRQKGSDRVRVRVRVADANERTNERRNVGPPFTSGRPSLCRRSRNITRYDVRGEYRRGRR